MKKSAARNPTQRPRIVDVVKGAHERSHIRDRYWRRVRCRRHRFPSPMEAAPTKPQTLTKKASRHPPLSKARGRHHGRPRRLIDRPHPDSRALSAGALIMRPPPRARAAARGPSKDGMPQQGGRGGPFRFRRKNVVSPALFPTDRRPRIPLYTGLGARTADSGWPRAANRPEGMRYMAAPEICTDGRNKSRGRIPERGQTSANLEENGLLAL